MHGLSNNGFSYRKPDFLIIGAPRAGTTWLWQMLKQHPGTALPKEKEPFFFSAAELYRKGTDWYYRHFQGVPSDKVTGEGSTAYFYDRVTYFYSPGKELVHDETLPVIPELIGQELPQAKIILCLRDPVERAISHFGMFRRRGMVNPRMGLRETAQTRPRMRIVEYGHYERYLRLWQRYFSPEHMCILIFEEDILQRPHETLQRIYGFLGLDPRFEPHDTARARNASTGWSRVFVSYYLGETAGRLSGRKPLRWLFEAVDKIEFLRPQTVTAADIEYLREVYLPGKLALEALLGRRLDCWCYGRR